MFNNIEIIGQMDSLKRFAYKLTRDTSRAEDLLQSTLLRAIEKKELYQAGTNLFSWASKIMYNIFVTNYRRSVRFETLYDPEIFIEKETVEPNQEHQVELRRVKDAMEKLSDDHREILVLVCVMGMQYAEVADQLHIPVGTVRSRLARARENLQHVLDTPSVIADDLPSLPFYDGGHGTRVAA